MASKNLYHKRLVAEAAAKPCWICYRPSSTVLITPENDDWFYICPGHLTDRTFATAKDAVDEEKKKREEELQREIEAVKKEHEEKMKKKKKSKKDDADKKLDDEEKAKDDKIKELEAKKDDKAGDEPRVFELSRHFYQTRIQKKQQAALAKKNLERLRNSGLPAVPTGDP